MLDNCQKKNQIGREAVNRLLIGKGNPFVVVVVMTAFICLCQSGATSADDSIDSGVETSFYQLTDNANSVKMPSNPMAVNTAADPSIAKAATELELPAKGKRRQEKIRQVKGSSQLVNVGLSLALVLILFFALAWILRKIKPSFITGGIPQQVVQVLGKAPLNARQHLQLVRLGDKILLLAVAQTGTEAVGEISDPDEVDAITEICKSKDASKIKETFRQTLFRLRSDRAQVVTSRRT